MKIKKLLLVAPLALLLVGCNKATTGSKSTTTRAKTTSDSKVTTSSKPTTKKDDVVKYTVRFDLNGGVGDISNQQIEKGNKVSKPTDPTRKGYTFNGWLCDGENWSFAGYVVTDDITLVASWSKNDYEVSVFKTFNAAGSVTGEGLYNYGDTVKLSETTFTGYTWIGWYGWDDDTDSYVEVCTDKDYTFEMPDEDTLIRAVWDQYTVSTTIYEESSGKGTVTAYRNQPFTAGKSVTVTATPKLAYRFDGWYLNNEQVSTDEEYTFDMPNNSITLFAKFAEREDLSNYEYTCTSNKLTITGVKDKTLSEMIIPDCVTEINQGVFAECSALTCLTLPFASDKVHSESDTNQYPFGYIFGYNSYEGSTRVTQNYRGSSGYTSGSYYIPTSLKTVKITGDNYIQYGAFYGCTTLTSVEFLGNSSLGQSLFYGCTNLADVKLPSGITALSINLFRECTSLETIELPDSVTAIGDYAFCKTGLKCYEIPNTIESVGGGAFMSCESLTDIIIPSSVKSFGRSAFQQCSNLENVYYKGTIVDWCDITFALSGGSGTTRAYDTSTPMQPASKFYLLDENGDVEFENNNYSLLVDLVIPDEVTELHANAFNGFNCLKSVVIPASVTTFGGTTFSCCYALQTAIIKARITSPCLYMFFDCNLKSIVFQDSLTRFYCEYFYRNIGLKTIYFMGTETQWSNITVYENDDYYDLDKATIYYYKEDQPTEAGNYWHYVDDVPTIWVIE